VFLFLRTNFSMGPRLALAAAWVAACAGDSFYWRYPRTDVTGNDIMNMPVRGYGDMAFSCVCGSSFAPQRAVPLFQIDRQILMFACRV